ncbi:N-acetylmuramoyl-L-alanine amidase AmiA precursor [Arcobacter porcinus]|uniref:N-acetylmuramoyl-L-alanine amidase n=1 Tax=Arcobacter porcinus TaxID=1935204 RepID=A0ABX2YEI9_9BACT|nr:N-acetylmuramoyl-L-alanine amidase [Arcobacter porcinus]OCL84893.1 N-acetylmuramoyl-L-alanine amidase AmiA precursor [Arcobacter porcinus]OCL93238.1 N-acetylmuramoyl-L-alanine amidase AmiA precursor [Arcobacter porcinus]
MRKDDPQKIEDLKKIIDLGKKLNKNVKSDEKKLQALQRKVQRERTFHNNINNIPDKKPELSKKVNTNNQKVTDKNDIIFSIKNVFTEDDKIVIEFNKNISQKDINFFKLNQKNNYREIYDISGYFKDALATKLSVNSDNKITIAQFKPTILRIVITNSSEPKTSYSLISNKKLIIKVPSNNILKKKDEIVKNIPKNEKETSLIGTNIDTKNNIREIFTKDNAVFIHFNKNFSKQDLKYLSYKEASFFEDIFEIKGSYKYANPIKLSIENSYKIVTTQEKGFVKLKFQNKEKANIVYSFINSKTLKISHLSESKEIIKKEPKQVTPTKSSPINTPVTQKITTSNKDNNKKVIVIDAGHGGDDVGAVGPNKRYEKVINLAVSKHLEKVLKQRGYKVYLTRTNDKFIKVMDRTILANQKQANLFLSIHTNSIIKSKASKTSGIETFFLSPARSQRAKDVAALENKSDIREMNNASKDVFLESLNRPRITASHKFAIDVQAGLLQAARSKYKDVNDSGVREGPFWVLVGAQMPSILVELGYVSHPEESRRLYESSYQEALAVGIANGIDSYFLKNP